MDGPCFLCREVQLDVSVVLRLQLNQKSGMSIVWEFLSSLPVLNVLALLLALGHDAGEHLVILKYKAVELHTPIVLDKSTQFCFPFCA
eukprot:4649815-Ditylum_brightwellii.AAC.1